MSSNKFMKQNAAIGNYVCNRHYIVNYNYYGCEETCAGFLLNYYGGNIVLLSEDGIYHIKYKDIVFMKPGRIKSLDKFNIEYQNLIKILQNKDLEEVNE
jgi:hypothetical protein